MRYGSREEPSPRLHDDYYRWRLRDPKRDSASPPLRRTPRFLLRFPSVKSGLPAGGLPGWLPTSPKLMTPVFDLLKLKDKWFDIS
jgi:hypothetical protein